ncbi:ABC transporter ATP-binding protein/permease [Alphaproteobacteria bacterium]|nr:ABC transporter ATP-binding protein/permease [Alphaproteobacteria bacterium]
MTDFIPAHKQPIDEATRKRLVEGASRHPMTFIERLAMPLLPSPKDGAPPQDLLAFFWHFAKQIKGALGLALFFKVLEVAADLMIPLALGYFVDIFATPGIETSAERLALIQERLPVLLMMLGFFLFFRPLAIIGKTAVVELGLMGGFGNFIRWQSHRHILGQDISFFSNDFAGRIANRVMQTGISLREVILTSLDGILYGFIYLLGSIVILTFTSLWLALPLLVWTAAYIALIVFFMPRIQRASEAHSELRSEVTGRIVDSYTNIQTVKLFANKGLEDANVAESIDDFNFGWIQVMRRSVTMSALLIVINAILVVMTAALSLWFWMGGSASAGTIATALPLVSTLTWFSGIMLWLLGHIFESAGSVSEGRQSIAVPHSIVDVPGAQLLDVHSGAISYDDILFTYGKERSVVEGLPLDIKPGEKIGLIGHSGAGKSTLVNLLLRFYDLDGGSIRIDGQDISKVQQDSLRDAIAMVTQDTSLLHRSIRDNIRYGKPDATDEELIEAAKQAQAWDFIVDLEDNKGRKAMEAHVGERGVKLSGGQRQRIALARVILKNAPILILDEATSALDSEVEHAIQEQLLGLMSGKTVIAIAHRLSTIARLDRLVVMEDGKIVEMGTHQELLDKDGVYARLWKLQSGGFLPTA